MHVYGQSTRISAARVTNFNANLAALPPGGYHTVARASERSEMFASQHCSPGSTSGFQSTGAKLPCAVLLRKEEANSSRMQLLEDK